MSFQESNHFRCTIELIVCRLITNSKIMKVIDFNYGYYIMYCNAREFNSFLKKKIKKDRLYLLDRKTKFWIKPMLKKLNRPFTIEDFE